jgi:hypothetical protein
MIREQPPNDWWNAERQESGDERWLPVRSESRTAGGRSRRSAGERPRALGTAAVKVRGIPAGARSAQTPDSDDRVYKSSLVRSFARMGGPAQGCCLAPLLPARPSWSWVVPYAH